MTRAVEVVRLAHGSKPSNIGQAPNALGLAHRLLLMFSGGRDSTLSAMRLCSTGEPIGLITVSSPHLLGIHRVRRRLSELAKHLPPDTPWLNVRQPTDLRTDTSFYEQTCLPCHHAYVVIAGVLAAWAGVQQLALGYVGYQNNWPEQTPFAISRLRQVLARHRIGLELPVHDIATRADAIAELHAYGLSNDALEQKCSRQVTNVTLPEPRLQEQVELWEAAIDRSLDQLGVH